MIALLYDAGIAQSTSFDYQTRECYTFGNEVASAATFTSLLSAQTPPFSAGERAEQFAHRARNLFSL